MTVSEKLAAKRIPDKKKPAKVIQFKPNNVISDDTKAPIKDKNMSERMKPKKGDRNYYKNFDFFFKRTCFRTMTLYFKLAYKPFFERQKQNKKTVTVLDSLVEMIKQEFPGLLDKLDRKAKFQFIELFKLLVLSHRHNKNDDFLKNPMVDFSVVRDPMYKFSQEAQDVFFNESVFAFLFAWFQAKPDAKAFAYEKFEQNSDKSYPDRLMKEVALLSQEAVKQLTEPDITVQPKKVLFMDKAATLKMSRQLVNYLQSLKATWTAAV